MRKSPRVRLPSRNPPVSVSGPEIPKQGAVKEEPKSKVDKEPAPKAETKKEPLARAYRPAMAKVQMPMQPDVVLRARTPASAPLTPVPPQHPPPAGRHQFAPPAEWQENSGWGNSDENREWRSKGWDAPLCKFYKAGRCTKGNSCRFRHEGEGSAVHPAEFRRQEKEKKKRLQEEGNKGGKSGKGAGKVKSELLDRPKSPEKPPSLHASGSGLPRSDVKSVDTPGVKIEEVEESKRSPIAREGSPSIPPAGSPPFPTGHTDSEEETKVTTLRLPESEERKCPERPASPEVSGGSPLRHAFEFGGQYAGAGFRRVFRSGHDSHCGHRSDGLYHAP